jgi:hypothetical protein
MRPQTTTARPHDRTTARRPRAQPCPFFRRAGDVGGCPGRPVRELFPCESTPAEVIALHARHLLRTQDGHRAGARRRPADRGLRGWRRDGRRAKPAQAELPPCWRARGVAGAAWLSSSWTPPSRAPCSRRSGCRAPGDLRAGGARTPREEWPRGHRSIRAQRGVREPVGVLPVRARHPRRQGERQWRRDRARPPARLHRRRVHRHRAVRAAPPRQPARW